MGNQTASARQMSAHKKHVIHTWTAIYNHNPQLINDAISDAWLKSAELTPTWVWALIDLPETMHSIYKENTQFLNIVNQVKDFLHILIKVHKCDPEMIKTLSFRLGARHRHYMNEGNDNSYWAPFAQQLPISIIKTYMHVVNNDNRIRRILRIRSLADKSEEEELCESWRQFMCMLVESMKRGYEGCASEKTPLRLSITNSIISMASLRSTRSRSASHFLEPNASPAIAPACTAVAANPPSPVTPYYSRRSIFRARSPRNSQDITALRASFSGKRECSDFRRQSSPNNPSILLNNSDLQLLRLTRLGESAESSQHQRRSLTLLPFTHVID